MPTIDDTFKRVRAQATDAVTPPKAGEFQARQVLPISISHVIHDTYTGFLSPLLPVFITNLALSTTEAGILTVFMQASSLLQPFIGHLADRVNLRSVVILGPAITAVMMSLLGVAPNYVVLALLLTVVGFNSASFHAVAPAIAGKLSGRNLGRGMGFWMVGGELGRVLGPIMIVSAVKVLSLERTPWLMIAGLLGSAALYVRLRNRQEPERNAQKEIPWRQALKGTGALLVPIVTIIVVRAFMTAALNVYLPTFLSKEGAGLWLAGASLSVFQAAGVVGALVGGSLSDRLGRRTVLLISLLITPLFLVAFLMTSTWLRLPILVVLGFVSLSINPVGMALVQESFPDNRALANGLYSGLGFTLRAVAVIVLGIIGDMFDLRLAFWISALIPLLGMPLILRLPKKGTA